MRAADNCPPLPEEVGRTVAVTRCMDDVKPERIAWLWPDRIALGKLTLVAGDPGLGKSTLTAELAAHVSRGTAWPVDHAPCPKGEVIIVSAEDDAADTLRPRLDAAYADPLGIHVLDEVAEFTDKGERRRGFQLSDVAVLDELLERHPACKLVVVDPISAYTGSTDTHKNAELRALLAPLADLAARHAVALLAVTHLNKGSGPAMYRTTGSLAFVAAARAVLAVTTDQADPERRLVLPVKNNLARHGGGLAYRIAAADNGAARIEWDTDPVTVSADEALAPHPDYDERTERDEAVEWLRELLADGPLAAKEVRHQASEAGLAWATVRRAKDRLGIRPRKTRFDGGWSWALPGADEDAQRLPSSEGEHLRAKNASSSDSTGYATAQGGEGAQGAQGAHSGGGEHLQRLPWEDEL